MTVTSKGFCRDGRRARGSFGAAMRFGRRRGATFALVLLLLGLIGCGGPTFEGSVYRGRGFAFRVPPPPASWKRIEVGDDALAFEDTQTSAMIAASGRCKVDGEDVPLRSLTQHLFLQFTERDVQVEEVVPFDGREALHTVVVAKLDGVPRQFDVWVLKKDGCVYDLYCIADPARFQDAAGPFRDFVRGFATVHVE
jgi:hypothetical protein